MGKMMDTLLLLLLLIFSLVLRPSSRRYMRTAGKTQRSSDSPKGLAAPSCRQGKHEILRPMRKARGMTHLNNHKRTKEKSRRGPAYASPLSPTSHAIHPSSRITHSSSTSTSSTTPPTPDRVLQVGPGRWRDGALPTLGCRRPSADPHCSVVEHAAESCACGHDVVPATADPVKENNRPPVASPDLSGHPCDRVACPVGAALLRAGAGIS